MVTATAGADAPAITAAARALATLAGAPDAHVIVTAAQPAVASQALVRVGPFDVAAGTATRLRADPVRLARRHRRRAPRR